MTKGLAIKFDIQRFAMVLEHMAKTNTDTSLYWCLTYAIRTVSEKSEARLYRCVLESQYLGKHYLDIDEPKEVNSALFTIIHLIRAGKIVVACEHPYPKFSIYHVDALFCYPKTEA
ncbi:MAG: hypothetical protein CME61_00405 [Halobacteriovoraceae bacterium]|nr:hypothetical protein [Halobacteriovoraceae bacterium]